MKLKELKANPDNPRVIKDAKFKKLVNSIKEFPKMMALRPMVIDEKKMVLGGNQRLKALQELGYKEIPDEWVKNASDLTPEEIERFIVIDNVEFGEHDWGKLESNWNIDDLEDWGLEVKKKLDKDGNYSNDEIYTSPLQLHPEMEYILVLCEKDEIDEAREHFGCGFVKKNNGAKNKIVRSRTVKYKDYVNSNTK